MITQLNIEASTILSKTMINPLDSILVKRIEADEYGGIVREINRDLKIEVQSMIWDLSHKLIRDSIKTYIKQLKEG